MIQIENEGAEILSTNYWASPLNNEGTIVCSLNAGALRLLIPDVHRDMIFEMLTGKEVIVSKGKVTAKGRGRGRTGYEFLFEDRTDTPFVLTIGENQMVPFQVANTENGKPILVSGWTRGPKKEFEMWGRFRVVKRLPCLAPWGEHQ